MPRSKTSPSPRPTPELSAVVVHWRNETELEELIERWPEDPRFELLVVDNSLSLSDLTPPARLLKPSRNLGFAGGANLGWKAAQAPSIVLLNPDAWPQAGALDELIEGLASYPEAAGLVPALFSPDGSSQHAWQLRTLPALWKLLAQTVLLPTGDGAQQPPEPGSVIEQPAAAALALRRSALASIGGLDEGFYPAWFEDVDLAQRLRRAGLELRYHPAARFTHGLGRSVPRLGYGPFLWVYYRNLSRYLKLYHGSGWAWLAKLSLPVGMVLRLALLPLRRPRRAASRSEAARGLVAALRGALSGWRRPEQLAARFAPPGEST